MQIDYVYPSLGDRTSPKEWVEKDKPDVNRERRRRVERDQGDAGAGGL